MAVREALASAFQNIYAEGYPDEESRWMTEEEILDYPARLAHYRRNGDPRYYKGVEYADAVEALARRRAAEAFAANGYHSRPNLRQCAGAFRRTRQQRGLSGLAQSRRYRDGTEPAARRTSLAWFVGQPLRASGSRRCITRLTRTRNLITKPSAHWLLENKPKLLIAGYSSYSWVPDWKKFREIADEVGAYFLADISHIGGLVAAGVVPSPIGYAHVVMSTTHKTLDGPRGAVLLTTDAAIAKKIDKAVFPGEQGGPHVNVFAGLALTFKLAQTKQFKKLQAQTIKNAKAMADQFEKRGLRVPFGGTDSSPAECGLHYLSKVKMARSSAVTRPRAFSISSVWWSIATRSPVTRIRLTRAGIRLGTPWITQRGFDEKTTRELADIMADVLAGLCAAFGGYGRTREDSAAPNLDFNVLNDCQVEGEKVG